MMQVGAYEAKTRLSELLDRVIKGEHVVITRHGVPVAVLMPVASQPDGVGTAQEVVETIRQFRQGKRLGPLSLREIIAQGRHEG
ncbi:MAG: type II toxin-antitoxin system prevent-host-death family antitoxin [Gloeomargarita sp. SKYG116]|nr:type II toxin-antitoxin system prevent-host-death family antitoxin [Gloeomargarita sp. SKYG116]MDW8402241.1 type II toxin-antitoxin system prevent-host-death family antitoxin [Gloeomargarita sp. SKYGB_i_bin116]